VATRAPTLLDGRTVERRSDASRDRPISPQHRNGVAMRAIQAFLREETYRAATTVSSA
jgi:hypothetical protein